MNLERIKLLVYKLANGWSILPMQMTVNISNVCHRKCRFCPNFAPEIIPDWYQSWWRKQPDFMDADKFADFIRRMGFWRLFIRQLSFTGRGETLLHPYILKFCDVAEKYRIKFHITTNGDYLTKELERSLSKYRYLNYVRVSMFDAHRGGYWLERQRTSPINIQFQNMTGVHVEGFKDGFISTNNPGTAKYSTMPDDFVDAKYCVAPFSFNTLNTDGSLVTCICFLETGNVFEQSFWECWNGKIMRQHRKNGLKMAIPRHLADCRNCGNFMRTGKYDKLNRYE